jgi:hypothetical protein
MLMALALYQDLHAREVKIESIMLAVWRRKSVEGLLYLKLCVSLLQDVVYDTLAH